MRKAAGGSPQAVLRRIVHVTTAWHGGVKMASLQYARALPQLEHHFIALSRATGDPHEAFTVELVPNLRAFVGAIARECGSQDPGTVLHVHSSKAAAWVRVRALVRPFRGVPIVYSPHGYSFIRTTLSPRAARLYRKIECILARAETATGVIGRREASLAESLSDASKVFTIPHGERVGMHERVARVAARRSYDGLNLVVGIGRLGDQKDPAAFARIVSRISAIEAVWVGDGDKAMRETLESAGIAVTGWLQPPEVHAWIARARVLLLTSIWEAGCPLVAGEALASGVPVIYRDIPELSMEFNAQGYRSEGEAAEQVKALAIGKNARALVLNQAAQHTTETTQAEALLRLYRFALLTGRPTQS